MIEFLVECIIEVFGEVIFQVLAEVLAELGLESLDHSSRRVRSANPFYAGCGFLMLGGLLGLLTGLLLPDPLLSRRPWPGTSLVFAPLGTGLLMHLFGSWMRNQGRNPTCLATFWGGACFAFGVTLVRWLMVTAR